MKISYSDNKREILIKWRWIDLKEIKKLIENNEKVFIVDVESKNHLWQ